MANRQHKTFMPLLCRFSQNDAVQPSKLSGSSFADPSSPKLSCIGQMKMNSIVTNKNSFNPCSLSASRRTGNSKSSVHSNRYKLFSKNIVSEKALIITSNNKCATNRSKSCSIGKRTTLIRSDKYYMTSKDDHDIMRVMVAGELDPPLPVVKCERRDQEMNVNLWKRRGFEMKTLNIQPNRLIVNRNGNYNKGEFLVPS